MDTLRDITLTIFIATIFFVGLHVCFSVGEELLAGIENAQRATVEHRKDLEEWTKF